MTEQDSPLVCKVSALTPQQHARRMELASRLRPMVRQVVPMPDGHALRLADQGEILMQVAEFLELERLCCPVPQVMRSAGGVDRPMTNKPRRGSDRSSSRFGRTR